MRTRLRAGGWLSLTSRSTWALVDLRDEDVRRAELIAAVETGDLSAALDVLLRDGVGATPAFAMVSQEDDRLRCLVRAAGTVIVASPEAIQTYSGHASPTWVDVLVTEPVDEVQLCAPLAGAAIDNAEVTRAGQVHVAFGQDSPEQAPPPPAAEIPRVGDVDTEERSPAAGPAAEQSYQSVFFDLLTANTMTRDALARSLAESQAEEAPSVQPAPPAREAPEPASPAEVPETSGHTAAWEAESSWKPLPSPLPPPYQPPVVVGSEDRTPPSGAIIDALPWNADAPLSPPPYVPPGSTQPPSQGGGSDQTQARPDLAAALREAPSSGPQVLGVTCPNHHWSAPYAPTCRVCSAPITEQPPQRIPRPLLGRLTLSTGAVVTLDRGVVFGREPKTSETGLDRPHLIKLEPKEISRLHAEVRLVDWQVLLRDLGSGNGTTLTLPGRATEMIRPNEEYALEPGAVIGLAELVTLTYEVA